MQPKWSTSPPSPSSHYLNLVQINIFGLREKPIPWLISLLQATSPLLQFKKLISPQHQPEATIRYSIICADRPKERGKGGGLAFLIHQSIQHWVLDLPIPPGDKYLEQQAIEVRTGMTSITINSVYCPPASSCTSRSKLSLKTPSAARGYPHPWGHQSPRHAVELGTP